MKSRLNEYMPWLARYYGNWYVVSRQSFGPPHGPEIYHRDSEGKVIKFTNLHLAWRVAHQLNKELYFLKEPNDTTH